MRILPGETPVTLWGTLSPDKYNALNRTQRRLRGLYPRLRLGRLMLEPSRLEDGSPFDEVVLVKLGKAGALFFEIQSSLDKTNLDIT